jgi:phosphatidylglycerophosphate synthase
MPGSLRTSTLAAAYYKLMQRYLLPRLHAWGLTPDRLTWTGLLVSLTVPLGFWTHPFLGFILISLSGLADSLDGLMARHESKTSLWGAFLDSSLDRVSDFFYLLGFWVLLWHHTNPAWATLAIFICTLLTVLISYTKARAEGLGCECPVGLMERGARVIFLLAWALVLTLMPGLMTINLWSGLALYSALCLATVIRRIIYVRRRIEGAMTGAGSLERNDHAI